jgi:hypothetical protein
VFVQKCGRAMCWLVEGCGALVAAAGAVLLYVSSLAWLKTGTWPPSDLQMFWGNMHSQWPQIEWIVGAQKIVDSLPTAILTLPLWITFLSVGGSIYILGFVGNSGFYYSTGARKKAK